jgi:cell division protein FtsW (lipid II flippase)
MLVLGIILLIVGYLLPMPILYTIGGILVIIGVVLLVLDAVGHSVGGRRWY